MLPVKHTHFNTFRQLSNEEDTKICGTFHGSSTLLHFSRSFIHIPFCMYTHVRHNIIVHQGYRKIP